MYHGLGRRFLTARGLLMRPQLNSGTLGGLMGALDAKIFRSTLIQEVAAAWQTLKGAHPQEHFYSFGFYTAELAEYLMVTASTEEGLTLVRDRYVLSQGGDPCLKRACLRWSPCDSPLHLEGQVLLPQSGRLRTSGPDPYDDTKEADEAIALVFDTAVEALQELDHNRLLGSELERAKLVLGVWKGDQSNEERVAFARRLNPPDVATRFARELEEGTEASFELSRRRDRK